MKVIFYIFISVFYVFIQPLFAEDSQSPYEQILNQKERPTLEQLIPLFEKSTNNPFPPSPITQERLSPTGKVPKAIAAFEKAFPGATWYELGRDAARLGDIFDAYYLSLHQKGRVKRLDASHPSFNQDYTLTYDFLKSNGIDVSQIEGSAPHVIFDTTSFSKTSGVGGGASQSTRTMRAAYQAYAKMGKEPKALIPKINFISIGGYYNNPGDFSNPDYNLENFFKSQRESVGEQEFNQPLYTDLSEFAYGDEWHPIFGPFERKENGEVIAQRKDGPINLSARKRILGEMYDIWKAVNQPDFQKSVQLHAHSHGFEFPVQYTTNLKRIDTAHMEKAKRELSQLRIENEKREALERKRRAQIREQEEKKMLYSALRLSPFAIEYLERYEDRKKGNLNVEEAARIFFEDIPSTDRLTDNDLSEISMLLLKEDGYENTGILKLIKETASKSPRYKQLMEQRKILKPQIEKPQIVEEVKNKLPEPAVIKPAEIHIKNKGFLKTCLSLIRLGL